MPRFPCDEEIFNGLDTSTRRNLRAAINEHIDKLDNPAKLRVFVKNRFPQLPSRTVNALFVTSHTLESRLRARFDPANVTFVASPGGRPTALTPEQECVVKDFISARRRDNECPTNADVQSYVLEEFHVEVSRQWVTNFVKRNGLSRVSSSPRDPGHANFTPTGHAIFLSTFGEKIKEVPAHRIANTDETPAGPSKKKEKSESVITDLPGVPAIRATPKKEKHITILPTIWLDLKQSRPMILTKGVKKLSKSWSEAHLAKYVHSNAWITAEVYNRQRSSEILSVQLFRKYLRRIFLKDVKKRRIEHREPEDQKYFLIMDNHPAHKTDKTLKVCACNLDFF